MNKPVILVTGGAGYIGSHMCVELLQAGYEVLVLDNLSNASVKSLRSVERLTQKELTFKQGDIRDHAILDNLFGTFDITSVIHFAGLKAVGESVEKPTLYYDNNINGTLALLQAMDRHDCKTLVFSSSATVYGVPDSVPIREDAPTGATNPYGRTKLMIEEMLQDLYAADPQWRIAILRYFNPVGAHPSGELGEDPNDIPNNLMPFVSQVAVGRRETLSVFGDDYDTPDGTGVRDYIHVIDLVRGHLAALEKLETSSQLGIYNLGTGQGYSVLEMVKAFEQVSEQTIPYQIAPRRAGDIATSFADPNKALNELGWQATHGLQDMCADAWRWQKKYPEGFDSKDG